MVADIFLTKLTLFDSVLYFGFVPFLLSVIFLVLTEIDLLKI